MGDVRSAGWLRQRQAAEVFRIPHDFNRYPPEYQDMVNRWLAETAETDNGD